MQTECRQTDHQQTIDRPPTDRRQTADRPPTDRRQARPTDRQTATDDDDDDESAIE